MPKGNPTHLTAIQLSLLWFGGTSLGEFIFQFPSQGFNISASARSNSISPFGFDGPVESSLLGTWVST